MGRVFAGEGEYDGVQYFGESARALVDDAIWLAVERGAAELRPDHLLMAASEPLLWHSRPGDIGEELIRLRRCLANSDKRQSAGGTPPFSRDTLELFQRAYLAAVQSGEGLIEDVHILLSLNPDSLVFLGQRAGMRLREILDQAVRERLTAGGVDAELLLAELGEFNLETLQPAAEFWHSQAGRAVVDLIRTHGSLAAQPFLILLGVFLYGGPAGEALCRSGLSEAILLEILATLA